MGDRARPSRAVRPWPKGDINGVLLDNGTELKLPPPAAYEVSVWVQPRQAITAQGYVLSNAFGRVMNVQAVGPSQQRLAQVTWMAPHGHGNGRRNRLDRTRRSRDGTNKV
jgi:hypothetical protein